VFAGFDPRTHEHGLVLVARDRAIAAWTVSMDGRGSRPAKAEGGNGSVGAVNFLAPATGKLGWGWGAC